MSRAAWAVALVAVAAALTFLPARRASPVTGDTGGGGGGGFRVGLVFDIGGRGDKSFNDAAYLGVDRAVRELGVQASYLEPAGTGDREAALRRFASEGYDLVIGVGFLFSSDIDAVARAFPRVHFACVDYAPSAAGIPANVTGLAFREEEGSFLVGAVAGRLTRSKQVGFVGGMKSPLIARFENGYRAGVLATCPSCKVDVAYVGASPDAFKDPAKGKAVAFSQIAGGADVLYHAAGASGHGVFEAAHDGHALAIGVDSDQHDDMPGTVVTSMIKRIDVAVFHEIEDARAHGTDPQRASGGMRVFGIAEDGVGYVEDDAHGGGIPRDVRAEVDALARKIASGEIKVPR
jgi:basic membrane protein A